MKRITKIIVGLIVVVILVSVSVGIWLSFEAGIIIDGVSPNRIVMDCEMDLTNKTLTVTKVYPLSYFSWSDIEVVSGNATLPTGIIDVGDVITNCSGEVKLVNKLLNEIFSIWNFEE